MGIMTDVGRALGIKKKARRKKKKATSKAPKKRRHRLPPRNRDGSFRKRKTP